VTPLTSKFLKLLKRVRLGSKGFPGTNSLAYLPHRQLNVKKLFFFVTDVVVKLPKAFVPYKPFQLCLVFGDKARSLPYMGHLPGAPFV